MRNLLGRWWAITAYAAIALTLAPALAAAKTEAVTMSVTPRSITRPIAPNFEGLALEYSGIRGWVGPGTAPPNPVLVQLIRNLDPGGGP